ncbi:MAG: Wzz/FepE/Etk N-terminal domain-containing protein [Bryobacteraceae bacterium]
MQSPDDIDELLQLQGAMVQYPFEARPGRWPEGNRGSVLQHVLGLWRRRRAIITLLFLLVMAGTLARAFLTARVYEAVLKIFIKRARIETVAMDGSGSAEGGNETNESDVRSEMEILRSRDLLERVVVQCQLASPQRGVPAMDRRSVALAVQKLEKDLLILPVAKTNIVAIKYVSGNPNQSAEVLKVLAALYIEKHTAMHRSHETSQFFADQANRYHADLVSAQKRLSEFEQRYGVSLLEERKELTLKRIGELEAAIQQLSAQAEDANNQRKVFDTEIQSLPATIPTQSRTARNEALLEQLKATLLELENKRVQLLTKFEPGYRLVTEVDQQIRATKSAIEREERPAIVDRTDAPNPLRQSIEAQLSQTQSRVAGLLAQRASFMKDLAESRMQEKTFEQVTAEYNDLQRQKTISENDFLLYQKKTEEAHIADALDQHKFLNVSILEDPVPPVLPVSRHSAFVLLLGFILAVLMSFGVALAVDSFDSVIRTPTELTLQTGLPVLASVSVSQLISKGGDEDKRLNKLGGRGTSTLDMNGA